MSDQSGDGNGTKISVEELSKHNSPSDAWLVIDGTVWDVTEFAPRHPGGVDVILEYLGQDATLAYNEVHSPSLVIRYLDASKKKGQLDKSTITEEWRRRLNQAQDIENKPSPSAHDQTEPEQKQPPLDSIINLYDFEEVAKKVVSPKSWAYYSGAANDCLSLAANIDWYRKIWFRPRVLVGVKEVDTSTTVLGEKYSVPIFTSPAALAKLSHPDGELAMARGVVSRGTTMCVCNGASYSLAEITEAMPPNYPKFFQLYFNKDRRATEALLREVVALKPRAILATVDLPVVGKREADERIKIDATFKPSRNVQGASVLPKDNKGTGLARATGSWIDPDITWKDIKWLIEFTGLPVFVKGVQCAADARKALEAGCKGIYISNHGGRAVDTAQPSILTLLEIQANCPEVLEKMEVFIDGGIRRGTDVLKAICLGASAVCLGRPFLYSLVYGQQGVEKAIDILKDELETAMQMVGITSLSQAHPGLLNTADIDRFVYRGDAHPWARKIVRQVKL
ncbi:L-lactate dehydrogenase (cytochrome) [Exophiala dermatitidis]